jgi:hypothetical protein
MQAQCDAVDSHAASSRCPRHRARRCRPRTPHTFVRRSHHPASRPPCWAPGSGCSGCRQRPTPCPDTHGSATRARRGRCSSTASSQLAGAPAWTCPGASGLLALARHAFAAATASRLVLSASRLPHSKAASTLAVLLAAAACTQRWLASARLQAGTAPQQPGAASTAGCVMLDGAVARAGQTQHAHTSQRTRAQAGHAHTHLCGTRLRVLQAPQACPAATLASALAAYARHSAPSATPLSWQAAASATAPAEAAGARHEPGRRI